MKRTKPLLYGVGKIDVEYPVALCTKVDGKWKTTWRCPIYKKWSQMLGRCYSESHQRTHPSYKGCTVDPCWFSLSEFSLWMNSFYWEGLSLDKDIILEMNKVYSPDTCCFVPPYINNLFLTRGKKRGDYPLGVSKSLKRYCAGCKSGNGAVTLHLGTYDTPEEAHRAWQQCKISRIKETIERYKSEVFYDERVYTALCLRIYRLEEDILCKKETLSL